MNAFVLDEQEISKDKTKGHCYFCQDKQTK